jgi:acyl-CoA dehydrogenase
VIELDDRLRALRTRACEWSGELRAMALPIDADPNAVLRWADLEVMRFLATFRRLSALPVDMDGHLISVRTALEQVVFLEEMAYGDLGALLAAPGAPMAGPLVELLGDDDQRERFFTSLDQPASWAFFALTEPAGGSDAAHITTELTPVGDGYLLTGTKTYIGNAPRARMGVVFARTGPGPLGVRAVLVDTRAPGFTATPLPTLGLRGAMLGRITMDAVPIDPRRLLGAHLPAARRGAWGWLRVFNLLRPGVAAMGLGVARAALDYVREHRRVLGSAERDRLEDLDRRIIGVRRLTYRAAAAVDADPRAGGLASAAKARSARLAEDVTLAALEFFGPGARLEHRLLDKLARDARGLEFMEGAGNVHRLLMSHDVIRGGSGHDRPA